MKRVFATTCLAAAFAVGLSAQQPPQTPSQTADKDKTVTLTGCVRAGDQPGSFVLANAKPDDKAAPGATGTSGTTSAPDTKGIENATLRLIGAPASVNLSEHVGHTVQITGTVAPSDKAPSSAATSGAEKSDKPEKSLNVRTVTMVSSSCSM
jgi:hypothetical protein